MAEPSVDLTLELLRQIRSEQAAFRDDVTQRFGFVDRRFEALEGDMREVKLTLRGLTYMMATFTGRLEEVETRVTRLEGR